MADGEKNMGFDFSEILQHYGQSGKSGMFLLKSGDKQGALYLMSGVIVHAETFKQNGETAALDILTWEKPVNRWVENETPPQMSMSISAQDLLIRVLGRTQSAPTRPVENLPSAQPAGSEDVQKFDQKTRSMNEGDTGMYLMTLDISSSEIKPFQYVVKNRQIRIGRHPENELVIADSSVSRKHAVLIVNNDAILVKDLGSMNGISIDGKTVTQGIVRDGQVLTIGEVTFRVMVNRIEKTAGQTSSVQS